MLFKLGAIIQLCVASHSSSGSMNQCFIHAVHMTYVQLELKLAIHTLSLKVYLHDMITFENSATNSTRDCMTACENFWKVFNNSPLRVDTYSRIQVLGGILVYFRQWKHTLPEEHRPNLNRQNTLLHGKPCSIFR